MTPNAEHDAQGRALGAELAGATALVIRLREELLAAEGAQRDALKALEAFHGFVFEVGWGYMSLKDNRPWICEAVDLKGLTASFVSPQGIARKRMPLVPLEQAYREFARPPKKGQLVGVLDRAHFGGPDGERDYSALGTLTHWDGVLATVKLFGKLPPYKDTTFSTDRVQLSEWARYTNLRAGGDAKGLPGRTGDDAPPPAGQPKLLPAPPKGLPDPKRTQCPCGRMGVMDCAGECELPPLADDGREGISDGGLGALEYLATTMPDADDIDWEPYRRAFHEAQNDRRNGRLPACDIREGQVPAGPLWHAHRGYAAGWEEG